MSRLVRGTAATASCLVGLSLVGAPSGGAEPPDAPQAASPGSKATTFRIHPGALPKGSPTVHPRLVGTTIRDGTYRREVAALGRYRSVWLYGRTAKGYLVGAERDRRAVPRTWYVPRRGKATRLRTGQFTVAEISQSGRLATFLDWRHGRERAQIRTIPGNRPVATIRAKRRSTWVDVLDMRGRRALLGIGSKVAWLDPRSKALQPVARRTGWWASARDNLLLTDEPRAKGGLAMVRLVNPRKVLWRRGMGGTAPIGISPDGRYLLSPVVRDPFDVTLTGLDVRRISDGRVVRRFRAEELDWGVTWVGGGHRFIVAAEGRSKTSLVRCRAAGRCERVGATVPTRPGMSPSEALGVTFRADSSDPARPGGRSWRFVPPSGT